MTSGSPAMAERELKIPAPSEVPPWVDSRSMAASTSAWTSVGGWAMNPPSPKATTPMRIEAGWSATNPLAAALAAAIRFGSMSSASMLFDTSKARITIPSRRGIPNDSWGRAAPTSSTPRARVNRAKGRWRRQGASARPPPVDTRPWPASSARRAARRASRRR